MIYLEHYLFLAAIIFTIGVLGIFLNKKNVIIILMSIELILLVAMVGSITLTLRDRGQIKRQDISQQNYLNANDSIEKKKVKLGEGI